MISGLVKRKSYIKSNTILFIFFYKSIILKNAIFFYLLRFSYKYSTIIFFSCIKLQTKR